MGLAFISCTENILETPEDTESVNGFTVLWRKNLSNEKKEVVREILNNMQFVSGGLFLMGATQEQMEYARINEFPAHYVYVSDFYVCKNEITIAQLEILMDIQFSEYYKEKGSPAYNWSQWRYVMDVIKEYSNIKVDFPTEAQWEYAARGGSIGRGHIFPGADELSLSEISENELGLYNLAKGLSEWCKDAYNEYPTLEQTIDPCCEQGIGHVVRGGNYESVKENSDYLKAHSTGDKFHNTYDDYRTCRVSARSYSEESSSHTYISCRPVINIISTK